jgi:acetate kinase
MCYEKRMNILVINAGSASIKYKLFDDTFKTIAEGCIDSPDDYARAAKEILRKVGSLANLGAIGHRVVHGGDVFREPAILDEKVIAKIEEFNRFAPLHNQYNIAAIRAIMNFLPDVPQIAVFDTAFYADLPLETRLYGLPLELSHKYKLYKYGFHGTSHAYAFEEAAGQLGKKTASMNAISMHLGGGWSITAIKNGKAIDTSMGLTPMEGLMMMTRAGDIDPGIIFEMANIEELFVKKKKKENVFSEFDIEEEEKILSAEEKLSKISDILNHFSGIKGISGHSDFLALLKDYSFGKERAILAFNMAVNRLVKYIGSYFFVLGGKVDAIVFTGRIGAGKPELRNAVLHKLRFLGKIKSITIEPNEELAIARKVKGMIRANK